MVDILKLFEETHYWNHLFHINISMNSDQQIINFFEEQKSTLQNRIIDEFSNQIDLIDDGSEYLLISLKVDAKRDACHIPRAKLSNPR